MKTPSREPAAGSSLEPGEEPGDTLRPQPLPAPPDIPPETAALYADHRGPDGYFNPWRPYRHRMSDVLRWWLSPNPYDKSSPLEVPRADAGPGLGGAPETGGPTGGRPAVTWIGHASFAIEDGGTVALTDPHFGPRALVPRRLVPPGLPVEAVPENAFAVLSHNHYDHLDRWSVKRLPRSLHWYVPPGMAAWFDKRGIERVTEVDWWHRVRHPAPGGGTGQSGTTGAPSTGQAGASPTAEPAGGWTLTALPAQHWSNRISQKRDSALWCSWLLQSGHNSYFFAGDSGYFPGFAEFGRRFPGIDVALMPVGAYEPRWFMAYQHMDPAQSYRAFRELGARHMLGMHWGTFDLTDEPADLGPRELERVVEAAGGDPRVRVPAVGERWPVPPRDGGRDGGRRPDAAE